MKTLAVMQPTYLPWLGYYNLIDRADVFVFLDDVQFSAQSWQQRNQIELKGEPFWLTVPVKHVEGQLIREVLVEDSEPWRRKHVETIRQAYAKAPHGREVGDLLVQLLFAGSYSKSLADINQAIITRFCQELRINTLTYRASTLVGQPVAPGTKSGRLIELCRLLGADVYLSPQGSRPYIEAEGIFAAEGIEVWYQEHNPSWPHLSAVHTIAQAGFSEAARLIANIDSQATIL